MNRLASFSLATGLALAAPVWAGADPADAYVKAWLGTDPAALVRALGKADYVDGDNAKTLDTDELQAAFVNARRPLRLVSRTGGDKTVLSWSTHTDGSVDYTDTLTFEKGNLVEVLTQGVLASPSEVAWAQRFEAARRDASPAVFRPVFTPDARIFGRNFPSDGATVDQYLDLLESIAGTIYQRLPDSPVRRAKDGHLYYNFELKYASGSVLVSGRDHLYRKGELVERLVGVY